MTAEIAGFPLSSAQIVGSPVSKAAAAKQVADGGSLLLSCLALLALTGSLSLSLLLSHTLLCSRVSLSRILKLASPASCSLSLLYCCPRVVSASCTVGS